MNAFTIGSAKAIIAAANANAANQADDPEAVNESDREAVRAAAEFLIANQVEVTGRVVVNLDGDELYDPAWSKVVANTFTPCKCGRPDCHAQGIRIIGPALREEIAEGEGHAVTIPVGERVYIGKVGGTKPALAFKLDPAEYGDRRSVQVHIFGREPFYLPFAERDQILTAPANIRTLPADGEEHLPEAAVRVETITDEAIGLVVHNDYAVITLRGLEEGSRVTVGAEKVYLRQKGAGDQAALVAFSTDASEGVLVMEQDPLNPMAALAAVFGEGPQSVPLAAFGEQSSDARTLRAPDGYSPLCLLNVNLAEGTVELVIDKEYEAYTPTQLPAAGGLGGGLGALLAGFGGGQGGDEDFDDDLDDEDFEDEDFDDRHGQK